MFLTLSHLTPNIVINLSCQASCSLSSTGAVVSLQRTVPITFLHQLGPCHLLKHFIPVDAFFILVASDHHHNDKICTTRIADIHVQVVSSKHGGGSLALVCQVHAERVVESELVSQLRASHRRCIAKPCLGARCRARTAVIREQPHIASTTGSADRYTDAVSFSSSEPATECIGTVPAFLERPFSTCRVKLFL